MYAVKTAHLEFELGDPVRFSGRAAIPLGKLFTHIASAVS